MRTLPFHHGFFSRWSLRRSRWVLMRDWVFVVLEGWHICRATVRYAHGMDRPKQTIRSPESLVPREVELALIRQGINLAMVRKEQHSGKGTNLATIVQRLRIGIHANPTNIPVRKQPRFRV